MCGVHSLNGDIALVAPQCAGVLWIAMHPC
jgi:hypothetical protein